jgi:hypothetical protein
MGTDAWKLRVLALLALAAACACEVFETLELGTDEPDGKVLPNPFVEERLSPYPTDGTILLFWEDASGQVHAFTNETEILALDGDEWYVEEKLLNRSVSVAWASPSGELLIADRNKEVYKYFEGRWNKLMEVHDDDIVDITGTSLSHLCALTWKGTVYYVDGTKWSFATTPGGFRTTDVWANSSDDIFVSGHADTVLHYNGASWEFFDVPVPDVYDIWASGPNDVWAVGQYDIAHYDGDAWSEVGPEISGSLYYVSGTGPGDVYVYGRDALLRYDGTQWEDLTLPPTVYVSAVWRDRTGRLFAGGSYGALYDDDGDGWRSATKGPTAPINGAWVSDDNDLFVVGDYNLIARYSDGRWEEMDAGIESGQRLIDVWGSSSNDVYVIGHGDASGSLLLQYDGASWSRIENTPGTGMNNLWGFGPGELVFTDGADALLYDGEAWTVMDTGLDMYLRDVWGTGPDNIVVVGEHGAVRYDGTAWRAEDIPGRSLIWCVWGSPEGRVFVGTYDGEVFFNDGDGWISPGSAGRPDPLVSISGSSSDNVYAVAGYSLRFFDGGVWTDTGISARRANAVCVDNDGRAYVVGDYGSVVRIHRR